MEDEDENEETEFGQDEVMEITPAKKVFYFIFNYVIPYKISLLKCVCIICMYHVECGRDIFCCFGYNLQITNNNTKEIY